MKNELALAAEGCRAIGYATIRLSGNASRDLTELEALLALLGEPIKVFRRHPFWKPLVADLDRPPSRSGGTGLNSLHMDCVNVEHPPDFVCLYCVRPDPLGGGETILSTLDGIELALTTATLDTLEKPVFRDGAAYDLDHVGIDVNPFPVWTETPRKWRYTGRLLEAGTFGPATAEHAALLEFDRIAMQRTVGMTLAAGEAVIIDQRRVLHGRLPLAQGQHELPHDIRRLLVQAYCRDRIR